MDLNSKHRAEINKKAFVMTLITNLSIALITGMTFMAYPGANLTIRLVLIFIFTVGAFVTFKSKPDGDAYKYFSFAFSFASYLAMIFTCDSVGMYVFIFPIVMLLGVFRDKKLCLWGGIGAVVSNIVYDVLVKSHGVEVTNDEIFVQMFTLLVAVIVSYMITSLHERQNNETMDDIEKRAAEEADVARGLVQYSKELGDQFDLAMSASAQLNECMDASNTAISEISDATKLTAEAVQDQTNQTSDIQENIANVDNQTQEMARLSEATKQAVEGGVKLINELKHQAAEVAKISRETEVTTRNLNESIQQVADITETINGISAQTNLLALNASIEAARAGEAGKGFAVVADEIRKLSEDTKNATGEITEIITKLMADAEIASKSMSTSAQYADKQNDLITTTGDKLGEIKANSDALFDGVTTVKDAVDLVLNANTAISDSISNLSATSEQVAASAENSLNLSEESMKNLQNMNAYLEAINDISNKMRNMTN